MAEWAWGLLEPGFVRWDPPPASQNHFNHCAPQHAYKCGARYCFTNSVCPSVCLSVQCRDCL